MLTIIHKSYKIISPKKIKGDIFMISEISVIRKNLSGENLFGVNISADNRTFIFSNISHSETTVNKLVKRLAGSDISSLHVADIIKDFIVENTIERLRENNLA